MFIIIQLLVIIQPGWKKSLQSQKNRADVLIFSGGLGPTKDDMTKETIAKHIGTGLVSDEEALHYIKSVFQTKLDVR